MARTNRRSGDGTPQFYGRWARLSIPLPRARRGWKSRAWRAPLQKKEDRTSLLSGPLSFFIPERATGFEPVTSSLGSWHSTPELRPQSGRNVFAHPARCQRHSLRYRHAAMVGPAGFISNCWLCPGWIAATCTVSVATTAPCRFTNSNISLYGAFAVARGFVTNPLTSRPVSVESNWLTTTSPISVESLIR